MQKRIKHKSFAAAAMRMHCFRRQTGQGATEYLVLLAVVLIVALVSVALLGFFPGMASDARMTQSQTYWRSVAPITIVEGWAQSWSGEAEKTSYVYLRIRNSGNYPIRITKLLGGSYSLSNVYPGGAYVSISDYYYMAPGEELYFGGYLTSAITGLSARRAIVFCLQGQACGWGYYLAGAQSVCTGTQSNGQYGVVTVKDFGFEYIAYVEGQQLTKRQVGVQSLVLKCNEPHDS